MYQKIMIPLDGSALAECVLPHAEAFIKGGMAKTAVLIWVLEPLPTAMYGASVETFASSAQEDIFASNADYWGKMAAERRSSAQEYLDRIAGRFNHYGADITCEIMEGQVAATLAGYAEKNNIDLLLIATHGRSGVSRWLMGSVADRVLHYSDVPVLMVRAPGSKTTSGN
jgi:nucleotide-binding universal stress UspA family protein